jgi:hypothetical protein
VADGGSASSDSGDADAATPDGGPTALRVLFIGNSYTYVNDLPGMLARIAATAGTGPAISTDEVVEGGATLWDHWSNGLAQARIAEGGWTHVVLQGQSLESDYPSPAFSDMARQFGELAIEAGAYPTLFVTWARASGDTQYVPSLGSFINPDEMQDRITVGYADVGRQLPGSILACVGEAFRTSLRDHPAIVLHQADRSHPTVAGTYLAASTFYVALTGSPVPPAGEVPPEVSAQDAALLREVALVGSQCADVAIKAIVSWRSDVRCHPFDFGTMGTSIAKILYLRNSGYSTAGIADGLMLGPPFVWTAGGAYPGGSGTVSSDGTRYDFCSASLPADGTCVLSVSYTPTVEGNSTLTLDVTNAYVSNVACELHGSPTTRALLTISEDAGFFGCTDAACVQPVFMLVVPGSTASRGFVVSNRGGAPTTALDVGTALAAPFEWGPAGAGGTFPGGSGTGTVNGLDYPYCTTPTLGVGEQCMVTVSLSPTEPYATVDTAVNVAYSDASGPVSPNANRRLRGSPTGGGL